MTGRERAVLAALVLVAVGIGAALWLRPDGGRDGPDGGAASPTATSAAPSPSPQPTESLQEQLERIAAVVAEVRELPFEELPEPTILGPEELAERVREQVSIYTPEEADRDARLLTAIGAIPPGTDLRELLITAYSEQVAGYYDPETGELVVGAPETGERLGRLGEVVLAHELQHALADQAFGLPDLEDPEPGREDELLAQLALIEGDATLTMQRYAEVGLSVVDQLLLAQEVAEMEGALQDLSDLPPFLQGSIEFPYTEGAGFVATLLEHGGWASVDAAYSDPPTSTVQILFPDRYLEGDSPSSPPEPSDPGGGWREAHTYGFGAADLLLLFQYPGGEPERALDDARAAAGAWAGGVATLWTDGDRSAVGIGLVGAALCDALDRWYAVAFPEAVRTTAEGATVFEDARQVTVLRCDGPEIRLGIAPDLGTATVIAGGR